MQGLELRMLGGLEVRRDGVPLEQPPSKKTRALLAYLALTARAHHRESLCSLLWDVTDDRRGALRWSLSKLRKLVDDDVTRLQTEGERVAFEPHGASIDVHAMRSALSGATLNAAPIEILEHWCERCAGEVLEGLDLPDFDAYQAWLTAEREQTRRLHACARQELVARTEGVPERALPHARAWIAADPMSVTARLATMRLALAAGNLDEAKRQYQSAKRVFGELDPAKEAEINAGWLALRAEGSRRSGAPSSADPSSTAPDASPNPPGPVDPGALRDSLSPPRPVPLIGREREYAELLASRARVAGDRRAEIVLLTGEPGIGKSRLLDTFVAEVHAQGSAVLRGAAFEGETGRPYGPWIDALRKLARRPIEGVPAQRLAPLLEGHETPASSREALFAVVVDTITALVGVHAPVVVVLDDVHWLDEGSAELLHYAARMQRDRAVSLVLAAREAELHDQPAVLRVLRSLRRDLRLTEIPLAGLPSRALRRLVEHVDPTLDSDRVCANSGGNPLFALELARAGAAAENARTVAAVVRDRIARLPADANEVLRWAAVLGSTFDPRLLAELSSLTTEQQLAALEELERHMLLRLEPGPRYAFSHEVVRGVVYSDLSQPRRTRMHHRTAEALCRTQHDQSHAGFDEELVADIARHASLGEGHALATSAYVAAGKRCLKLFASENALAMVRKGLWHARELSEPARCRSLIELYDVQLWAAKPAAQEEFCRTVGDLAELALQHGCLEHARLGFNMLSYVRWETGSWDEARRQTLKAEQVMRSSEGHEHIDALAQAARCLGLLERDLGHAEAMLAEANARAKQLGYQSAILGDAEGLLLLQRGDFDDADARFERSCALASTTRDRYTELEILMNRIQLNFDTGRNALALELARKAEQLASRTRDGSEGPYARVLVSLAALSLDEGGLDALEQALAELRLADAKHRLAYGLTRGAAQANRCGQPERARAMAVEAIDIARLIERSSEVVLGLVQLATAQKALGDRRGYAATRKQLLATDSPILSAHARQMRAALLEE